MGSLVLLVLGLAVGYRPVYEYITERYVHALPSAILAASLIVMAFFSSGVGLDSQQREFAPLGTGKVDR